MIVEDDPEMVSYLSRSIERCPQLRLVGHAGSVAEALRLLGDPWVTPDVLLVDLGLPDGSGLHILREIRASRPACESLVVSMFGDDETVLESIEAGALGYIHKDAQPDDITQTILDMKAGGSPISPMIARRLLARCLMPVAGSTASPDEPARPEDTEPAPQLSPREQDVLTLISKGFTYAEIARLQSVTVNTIRSHIKNLYIKLSVHSRSEAVFEAKSLGLLRQERPGA